MIRGLAFHCGDCVDTDVMSPGRFEPYDGNDHLARVALCDYPSPKPFVDAATGKSPYTVIFAGDEFGCGSSRETAPQALAYAGARVVIARSFANIFFRNCVNMGLLLPVVHDHPFDETVIGEEVEVDPTNRWYRVGDRKFHFADLGPLTRIVNAGGLTKITLEKLAGRTA